MRILVTGAKGFVGRNLCLALSVSRPDDTVWACDLDTPRVTLEGWLDACDVVIHLAGVNRPQDPAEFRTGNTLFTEDLLARLAARSTPCPVALASSTQAALENDYGRSKKAAEEAVRAYARATGAAVYVFRFANVFGKWCRPNYNSAVATWCHNIARDLPIQVRDPAALVTFVYIDDVVAALCGVLDQVARGAAADGDATLSVEPSYTRSLGEIVALLRAFRAEPETLDVPDQRDGFTRKLYATYLSALPEDAFSYPLVMHEDARGSFTEALHSAERGQVSVNVSRPGIVKGEHWHHTKHEKFLVVSGTGVIRFRRMDGSSEAVLSYPVSGAKLEVVRIPPGYTHNIENTGATDLVTLMWANEVFDPAHPDTYRESVQIKGV